MSRRSVRVVLELEVRDMTQEEWDEANEGGVIDEVEDLQDEISGPYGWVADLEPNELIEPIEGALVSADNPEIFAGSGLFLHIGNAVIKEIGWAGPLKDD